MTGRISALFDAMFSFSRAGLTVVEVAESPKLPLAALVEVRPDDRADHAADDRTDDDEEDTEDGADVFPNPSRHGHQRGESTEAYPQDDRASVPAETEDEGYEPEDQSDCREQDLDDEQEHGGMTSLEQRLVKPVRSLLFFKGFVNPLSPLFPIAESDVFVYYQSSHLK